MNGIQKAKLDQFQRDRQGARIIDGKNGDASIREDGYTNMLNKYGTKQDNSTAYIYTHENISPDLELIDLYESNGLFKKIIDRPSEEAVKHGLDIDFGDDDVSEYVEDALDRLEFEDRFATAEKWARLYGGAIIVMLIEDGRGLEEPVDWNAARSIEELRVFERAIVQPDYSSLYKFNFLDTINADTPFDEPEYYQVFSIYGYFTVHRTRCLVFRNGRLPEQTTNANYRYWGIPEYIKLKRALRECITTHENGTKLLERSVQAIYKMKNLANLLSTDAGEDKVLQRLQVIDMARGILNSIAIDTDGEEYSFETLPLSGVKDIIDATCNMLSAVTDIPQTILFGRSPAGMNATGESDFENYYNMVENIQKQNMKRNSRTVIDLILRQGMIEGKINDSPKYKVKFAALWSLSDADQASVDQTKAQTEYTKAQTAQLYIDSQVIDPSEVRHALASEGSMEIEDVLSDEKGDLDLPEDTFDLGGQTGETISISGIDEPGEDESDRVISIEGIDTEEDSKTGSNEVISISGVDNESDGNGRVIRIITADGGPGSGNFGHVGRPGKIGGSGGGKGSAESAGGSNDQKNYNIATYSGTPKEQMQKTLAGLGHKQEDIDNMRQLFRAHSLDNADMQKDADDEIMRHIRDKDSIGKLLEDKARVEELAWGEQQAAEKQRLERDYNKQVFIAEEQLKPGGMFENYTKEELQDMNYWPVKKEYVEPRLVRVGNMDRDILAFSSNPDGAESFKIEYADPSNVHELSVSDLAKMGYRPIAGIATFDVGQSGDGEVLFAKFPKHGSGKDSDECIEGVMLGRNSDGGIGSGDWGHSGRPGKIGGSGGGGGKQNRTGTKESGFSSAAKDKVKKTAEAKNAGTKSSGHKEHAIAEGKDISKTYEGTGDIKSVIKTQGFDGLPKVVSQEEFDEAVSKSRFIAQRVYAASSQEILDAYQDQLYNGEWYVECSVGGAQYGQGMYCAADYEGKLTDGIKNEMEHYVEQGKSRESLKSNRQKIADQKNADAEKTFDSVIKDGTKDFSDDEKLLFKCYKLYKGTDEENDRAFNIMGSMGKEERAEYGKKANKVLEDAQAKRDKISWMSVEEYAEANGLKIEADPVYRIETLTLDSSAKIISFKDLSGMYYENPVISEKYSNIGSYAAALGYDAINASDHGESGSYTVILNRTKTIILNNRNKNDSEDSDIIRFQVGDDGLIYAIRNRKVIGWVKAFDGAGKVKTDGGDFKAAAVLIIQNGLILCATRSDGKGVCGPGGHIEAGETPAEAAIREAQEEFKITPLNIIPYGELKQSPGRYISSKLYFTDQFNGEPKADGDEMLNARWMSIADLRNEKMHPAFEAGLDMFLDLLENYLTTGNSTATLTPGRIDGGPGSGNFGHEGRPGKIGGSSGESGSQSGGSEYSERIQKERKELRSLPPNKQALELYRSGACSKSEALNAIKDGSVDSIADRYFDAMEKNGDPTPTKKVSGQVDAELADRVKSGEFADYADARIGYIREWTGSGPGESAATYNELQTWFGGRWDKADTETLDKYIDADHAYNGQIHRGLHFEDQESFDIFMDSVNTTKEIRNNGMNSSWSSREGVAREYAHTVDTNVHSVVMHCLKNRTSAPVSHLSSLGEDEVLSNSKAAWTVLHTETSDIGNGHFNVDIYVVEKGGYQK